LTNPTIGGGGTASAPDRVSARHAANLFVRDGKRRIAWSKAMLRGWRTLAGYNPRSLVYLAEIDRAAAR